MARIAVNGLGRIGKLVLRDLVERGGADIVLLNDADGDPAQTALLMACDAVHGRWPAAMSHDNDSLTRKGQRIRLTRHRRIEALPLAEMGAIW